MAVQKKHFALLLISLLQLSILAAAQRSTLNTCTSANYEYYLETDPGDLWYYRGSANDPYCLANPLLSQYVCGVSTAPACPQTKAQTCAIATYPDDCNAAPRVFAVNLDADCDYLIVCEFLDTAGTTAGTGGTLPIGGSTPAVGGSTPAVTDIPGGVLPLAPKAAPVSTTLPVTTRVPVVTLLPAVPASTTAVIPATTTTTAAPNLLPKPNDVVLTSAYAIGVVSYACSKTSSGFGNVSIKADLYSNGGLPTLAGSYVSSNGSQIFTLINGAAQVIGVGGTYATPSNLLTDGGYGSLNQTYYTATGTLSLATVSYVTQTVTSGGVLPKNATCARTPIGNVTLPPWQVPFQANYTFFSTYSPPL